jgi:hypothetical protein
MPKKMQPAIGLARHTKQKRNRGGTMNEALVEELVPLVGILVPISLFAMLVFFVWFGERRKAQQSLYRSELLKKIAESPGDAAQKVLEMLRQEESAAQIRRREGMKLGGLIVLAVGIALMPLLARLEPSEPVWLVGLIPTLVGVALLVYVFLLSPRPKQEDRGISKAI